MEQIFKAGAKADDIVFAQTNKMPTHIEYAKKVA